MSEPDPKCVRCGRPVASVDYETFERMHYVCFHYEFEHGDRDVDVECSAGGCPSRNLELRSSLADWTDWDVAMFGLARAVGIFGLRDDFARVKGTFWSDNPTGNALHRCLEELVDAGVLERRVEPDEQFRWARKDSAD